MAYSEKVLDYFYNPRNVGVIKGASGMGKVGSLQCGDIIKLYIQIESDKIVDAKFQAFGCAPVIAASSLVTELVVNKQIDELSAIDTKTVLNEIGGLPENKKYCAELAASSITEAIADYERKQKGEKKPRKKQIRNK